MNNPESDTELEELIDTSLDDPALDEVSSPIPILTPTLIPTPSRIATQVAPIPDPYAAEDEYDLDQDYRDQGGDDDENKEVKITEAEADEMIVAYEKEKEKRSKRRFTAIMAVMIGFATLLRWWDENDGGLLDSDFLVIEYLVFTAAMLYLMGTLILKPIFFWKGLVATEESRTVAAASAPFEEGASDADTHEEKMKLALANRIRR